MTFEILGPLSVRREGRAVALGAGKERTLLALLLLEHGQVVGIDRVIEELWRVDPPGHPVSAVRVLASRLRRSLAAVGLEDRVKTVPPGYLMAVAPGELDARRFVDLAREGAVSLAAGQAESAAELLRGALALWRGDVLCDVPLGEGSRPSIRRLEEERLVALELRIEADLACDRQASVIGELEELVRDLPLREGLWQKLVTALGLSGRSADAVRRSDEFRQVLAEVGLEPSPSFGVLADRVALAGGELERHRPASSDRVTVQRPPLPRIVAERRVSLIGRRREVARLLAMYEEVAAGTGATVLISGEPGVGKTSMVAEIANLAHARGATVLYGQCDEDLQIAYQPFREALHHYLGATTPGEVERILTSLPQLSHLAGLWGRPVGGMPAPGGDAEGDRDLLFDAVESWIRDLTSLAPLVLIVDDLHWASPPTVQLLRHLARQRWWPLMCIATFRDTEASEPAGLRELLESVHRQPSTHRLRLTGLDREAVALLLDAQGGSRLDSTDFGLVARIHEETGGNPLFATELVRHLLESGFSTGPMVERFQLPEGVTDVIRQRLERLSTSAGQVLRVAATVGQVVPFMLLSTVSAGFDSAELLDVLDEVTQAGLLIESGDADFAFAHALVRKTVYASLSAARRRQLHRAVGEALTRLPSPMPNHRANLAYHFRLGAGPGDGALAASHALLAGREALDEVAHEAALEHFSGGLDVLQRLGPVDRELEADLLLGLAQVAARTNDHYGRVDNAWKAAEAARAAGSHAKLATAAYWMCRFGIVGAIHPGMVALCEEALAGLGDEPSPLKARVTAALAGLRAISGEGIGADPLAVEAVALARATGDAQVLAEALDSRVMTLSGGPDIRHRLGVADEMVRVAEGDNARIVLGSGYRYRALARLTMGDRGGFDADFAAMTAIAEQMRDGFLRAVSAQWRAALALLEGRFDEVEYHADQAVSFPGGPNFAAAQAAQLFWLHHERGDHAAVLPLLEAAVADSPGIVGFRAALSVSYAATDRPEDARRELHQILAGDPIPIPHDWIRIGALTLCAETAATLGDAASARQLEGMLRPFSGQLAVVAVGTHCQGAVDRFRGMLAGVCQDWERAETLFSSALVLEEGVRSPTNAARTRLWYAQALLRDGADEVGRELANEARATAVRLGMTSVATEAADLLRGMPGEVAG